MSDKQIINFSESTGILTTTLFACQQETGGDDSTQKIPFSEIVAGINALEKSNNLSDLTDFGAARVNLGLGNVDNTSDANKPVSTATQAALDLKANANSCLLSINGDTTQNQVIAGGNGTLVNTNAGLTTVEIDFSVTQKANVFNGGNQLVETDNFGKIIAAVIPSFVTQQGNVFNGISQLVQTDVAGKIPLSVLPTGSTVFRGTWNASTNTPTLSNSTPQPSGYFYITSVAGTVNFGAGNISFDVGDWVISNGTNWQKVDNSDAVTSVNGAQGAISLGIHNLDDTQAPSPTNNQVLTFKVSSNKWENFSLGAVAYSNDYNDLTNKPTIPSSLGGDVTGPFASNTVSSVGGKTAGQISTSVNSTLSATSLNTANTLVLRDGGGNSSFSTPTSALHAVNKAYADSGFQQIFSTSSFSPVAPFISGKVYIVDPTLNASVTFGLPAASSVGAGFIMTVKSNNLGTTTLVPTGGDTLEYNINNLGNSNSVSIISNGSNSWHVLWNDNITGVVNVINGISSLNSGVVSNVNLANMPANTVKANTTGVAAPPSDVSLASFKAWLGLMLTPNRMVLTDGSGNIITNGSYVVDGLGSLTTNILNLSAGGSTAALNLTGSGNVLLTVTSKGTIARSGAANAFLTGSADGDICIIQNDNTKSLLLGMASATPNMSIVTGRTDFTLPVTLPQTQGGIAVTGSVKTNFEYYEDQDSTTAFTTNSTGAIVFTGYKIRFQRVGSKVTMYPDTFSQNAVAGQPITLTSAIPARFRPPSNLQFNVAGQNGGPKVDISFTLSTGGNIVIYGGVNNNNFTNGNTAAYFGQGMSFYLV